MRRTALFLLTGIFLLTFMAGCGSKSEEEYEKPALYWYQKMMKKIASGNLEKADNIFTSLESEHISSPLIPQAMLILMQAHMDNEEIVTYPQGEFTPMVHTMEVRLQMTQFLLNEKIASLYDRRGKPKAAEIYRKKNDVGWIRMDDIEPPSGGWFGWLFE